MSVISNQFMRFYYGVVLKQIRQIQSPLVFHNKFKIRLSSLSVNSSKQMLKMLDLEYPKDSTQMPISLRDIENSELIHHIDFLISVLAENKLSFKFIDDEWQRLLKEIR